MRNMFCLAAVVITHWPFAASQACEKPPQRPCGFSQVVGVQTISAPYRLTPEPALIEMAKAVRELGSDTLKLSVSAKYPELYHIPQNPRIKSVRDLVASDDSFKTVLGMPFHHLMLWLYPFSDSLSQLHEGKMSPKQNDLIYREIYDFTAYLLKTYTGTGKSFYLGNWEGDWHTVKGYDQATDPTPGTLTRMRDWLLLREKAVSDARRDTPHQGVNVFFYVEINHVRKAMKEGRPAIVNRVLPHIKTDFVSYSSYDVTKAAMRTGGEEGKRQFFEALDYIEKHLPPSDMRGKRVMIGEYGVTLEAVCDPAIQAKQVAQLMSWALEWGCPFVLYWQLYCNEINPQTHKHRGYWLIDDHGVKQPVWHLHHDFLRQSQTWSEVFRKQHHRAPNQSEYNKAALEWVREWAAP